MKILPYRGYGNQHSWFLMGRVLEDRRVGSPQADDSWWDNAKAMYARFATDEIVGVRVRASIEGQTAETITDEEGYFRFHLRPTGSSCPQRLWQSVALQLLDEVCPGQGAVTALGSVLVPARDSDFGVISDVDDTVIESHATDFLKMARITFTNNARTRTPLPGVSRFYQALARGPRGNAKNPFFYVSSSAWNLYDLLIDFLDLHDIPAGPILLRDLGIDDKKFIKSGHEHKLEKISPILNTCRDLPFVLIGDAGQEDPTIYREVVRRHADRIKAIYIRAVAQRLRNERAMQMAQETTRNCVPMLLVEDVEQAMRHAADLGLVAATAVQRPSTAV